MFTLSLILERVEDILCSTSNRDNTCQGAQTLQTCVPYVTSDEEHGEGYAETPATSGERKVGSTTIRLSARLLFFFCTDLSYNWRTAGVMWDSHFFSFAFNTKHPSLLRGNLIEVGVVTWLRGLLTTSPADHNMWGCMTVCLEWEPAALEPRRGRCSPLFWSLLFTSDFTHNTSNCHLQEFSSDTAIVGGVSEEDELI